MFTYENELFLIIPYGCPDILSHGTCSQEIELNKVLFLVVVKLDFNGYSKDIDSNTSKDSDIW